MHLRECLAEPQAAAQRSLMTSDFFEVGSKLRTGTVSGLARSKFEAVALSAKLIYLVVAIAVFIINPGLEG